MEEKIEETQAERIALFVESVECQRSVTMVLWRGIGETDLFSRSAIPVTLL